MLTTAASNLAEPRPEDYWNPVQTFMRWNGAGDRAMIGNCTELTDGNKNLITPIDIRYW
jgi:hypothetical protein